MIGPLLDQVRRLDLAERRWLEEARARLRRTTPAAPAVDARPKGER
ncbi:MULTISPECIES: hypothetical protein [Nocardioides]|uniref:PadR family transcriptional regulator n=1 Tax=Nocardioides vastitatis TaxID=2568655 RepID=A0ABW0ZIM0_9ACTN|nr:hypothetical protein [Nocardioides sp.]